MARARQGAAALAIVLLAGLGAAGAEGEDAFIDGTAASGIDFRHVSGAFGGKWMPESLGAGVALFDADGDGWTDILLVQGGAWGGHEEAVQ